MRFLGRIASALGVPVHSCGVSGERAGYCCRHHLLQKNGANQRCVAVSYIRPKVPINPVCVVKKCNKKQYVSPEAAIRAIDFCGN